MISAVSKYGAASSAKRTISTAPMAKFGAITALALDASKRGAELVDVVGAEPGRADDRVHAVLGAPGEVVAGGVDHGEVDRDLGAGVGQRVGAARAICRLGASIPNWRRSMPAWSGSTAATSSSSGSSQHRLAHRGAHAPAGAEHTDSDHRLTAIGGAVDRRASDAASVAGPDDAPAVRAPSPSTRSITRPTSSAVTASTCSTTPSRLGTSPMVSSLRPMRCMRLDELSSDSASDPVRWPLAPASSRSVTPPSATRRSSSPRDDVEHLVDVLGRGAAVHRQRRRSPRTRCGTRTPSTPGRASRAPPGTGASSCRRRAPGRRPRARSGRDRRARSARVPEHDVRLLERTVDAREAVGVARRRRR